VACTGWIEMCMFCFTSKIYNSHELGLEISAIVR